MHRLKWARSELLLKEDKLTSDALIQRKTNINHYCDSNSDSKLTLTQDEALPLGSLICNQAP